MASVDLVKSRWFWPFVVAFTQFAIVTGFASYRPDQHLSDAFPGAATMLLVLIAAWPSGPADRRLLAVVAAACGVVFGVTALLFGYGPVDGLRMGIVAVGTDVLLLYGYRRVSRTWFPTRVGAVGIFAIATVLAAIVTVVLGGVPGAGVGGTGVLSQDVAWAIRLQTELVSTGLGAFGLVYGPRPTYCTIEHARQLPALMLIGGACVVAPFVFPDRPLAWLICVPAMWVGMTMTPGWATVAMTPFMLVPSLFLRPLLPATPDGAVVGPAMIMEVLLFTAPVLSTIIVVLRENTARTAAHADAAARAEAAQSELLRAVVAAVDDGVLLTDHAGRILVANPAARALLGTPVRSDAQAWLTAYGLTGADGAALPPDALKSLLAPPAEATTTIVRLSGPDRVYSLTAQALAQEHRRLTLVVMSDVTEQHRRHADLETFAGTVAHDLKNPLAALALWLDLADADALGPDAPTDSLRRAHREGARMRDLIDDYLAHTVTRQGQLRPGAVDLASLVADVASTYDATDRPPELTIDVTATVQADPALLRQLLANLLANSVKYARPGDVASIVVRDAPADTPGWILITVADRGVGIDAADTETIFQPFARVGATQSTATGIGLGLALCQAIVTRHGGTIRAESNGWGGTTIAFTLPDASRAATPSLATVG